MHTKEREGPGLWWQLLEFMGMTWPGRRRQPDSGPSRGPRCAACHNPTRRDAEGRWRCPDHPGASLLDE